MSRRLFLRYRPSAWIRFSASLSRQIKHWADWTDSTSFLPDLSPFIYAYVRKEALLSSQIEGTQSSLSDLLLFENQEVSGIPIEDVQDVSNYVAALSHGLKRIREGFPLSLRLIRENSRNSAFPRAGKQQGAR